MWHFQWGVKTYSDPSYIFSGGQDPNPPGSTPLYVTSYSHTLILYFKTRNRALRADSFERRKFSVSIQKPRDLVVSNHMLRGDQTRLRGKFYRVDHAPCPGHNFFVTRMLMRDPCGSKHSCLFNGSSLFRRWAAATWWIKKPTQNECSKIFKELIFAIGHVTFFGFYRASPCLSVSPSATMR